MMKLSCMLRDGDSDDPALFMFGHVHYRQAKRARLEAELKIAEIYAYSWRRKHKMI